MFLETEWSVLSNATEEVWLNEGRQVSIGLRDMKAAGDLSS